MPGRVRKRKKSASPGRAEASHKRTRQLSATATSNNNPGSGSALPTSTDYRFRLKVISSSLKVADEVFEEAVQGLAQICFPQTILDELGVEVIASHMQQEGAPRENIDRMRSIFPSIMVQQVAWMLAQYTDTPEKLESAISAVADASRALHERRLSSEAMSGASKIAEDTLESYDGAGESSKDEAITPREEVEKRRKQDKKSKHSSKAKKGKQQDKVDENSEHLYETGTLQPINVDGPASTNQNKAPMNKERKVSKSWRWDVDSKALTVDGIPGIFKRISDLFAYHALPVVQQELGSLARKKDIRVKIQSILVDMSDGEYEQWADSFRKLNGGDITMLERVSPESSAHGRYIARATPAPTSRRPQRLRDYENGTAGRQQDSLGSGVVGVVANPVPVDGSSQVNIKRENVADLEEAHIATGGASDGSDEVTTNDDTPVINLLWGRARIHLGNRFSATQVIMDNLNKRVSVDAIDMQRFDGTTQKYTKQSLHRALNRANKQRLRDSMEETIQDWVIANPTAFSELSADALFFVNIMPCNHQVLDLLYDEALPLSEGYAETVKNGIIESLRLRGYPEFLRRLPITRLSTLIVSILQQKKGCMKNMIKRAKLEKILRRVAFEHREKFPELKRSRLVGVWQQTTGQKW